MQFTHGRDCIVMMSLSFCTHNTFALTCIGPQRNASVQQTNSNVFKLTKYTTNQELNEKHFRAHKLNTAVHTVHLDFWLDFSTITSPFPLYLNVTVGKNNLTHASLQMSVSVSLCLYNTLNGF